MFDDTLEVSRTDYKNRELLLYNDDQLSCNNWRCNYNVRKENGILSLNLYVLDYKLGIWI